MFKREFFQESVCPQSQDKMILREGFRLTKKGNKEDMLTFYMVGRKFDYCNYLALSLWMRKMLYLCELIWTGLEFLRSTKNKRYWNLDVVKRQSFLGNFQALSCQNVAALCKFLPNFLELMASPCFVPARRVKFLPWVYLFPNCMKDMRRKCYHVDCGMSVEHRLSG